MLDPTALGWESNLHLCSDPSCCSWILNPQHQNGNSYQVLFRCFFVDSVVITIRRSILMPLLQRRKLRLREVKPLTHRLVKWKERECESRLLGTPKLQTHIMNKPILFGRQWPHL